MDNNEQIHALYQQASCCSKRLFGIASLLEAAILAISICMLMSSELHLHATVVFWAPFVFMCLAILAFGIDQFASSVRAFAQRCRRVSLKAYAMGAPACDVVFSDLFADSPSTSIRLFGSVKVKSLDEYYSPNLDAGISRLRELNLHSAFWTWNLLRFSSSIYFLIGGALAIVSFAIFYYLAKQVVNDASTRVHLIEIVCTVIVAVVFIKCWKKAFAMQAGAARIKSLDSAMVQRSITTESEVLTFAEDYNLAREVGPDPQRFSYVFLEKKLSLLWQKRVNQIVATELN